MKNKATRINQLKQPLKVMYGWTWESGSDKTSSITPLAWKHGKRWSNDDKVTAHRMAMDGVDIYNIGKHLGRSHKSIQLTLGHLAYSLIEDSKTKFYTQGSK